MVVANPNPLHLVADGVLGASPPDSDGARTVFLDLGFDGAHMGEIARSAGVSKGTLYVYFADKHRLFEASRGGIAQQGKSAFNFDPERDVEITCRSSAAPTSRCFASRRRLGDPHRDAIADGYAGSRPQLL